jgi:hypothetical protein
MTNWDTPALAVKLFDGRNPPNRDEYVLDQGFTRDLGNCKNLLPEKLRDQLWPAELNSLPGDGSRYRINRATLFAVAERVAGDMDDESGAAQLHSGITFWGAPPGLPMQRACRPLGEAGATIKLAKALKTVQGEGPVSAYKAVIRGGRLAVRGLGPSYFTKLFYFGGYELAKPGMPKPLIMDDNVIEGLARLTEQPWTQTVETYSDYLDLASDLAFELHCEPDVIERRLFDVGALRGSAS